MFGLIGDRLRKLLDGTSSAAVAATGRRPRSSETGFNGSTDNGLRNNEPATEAVANSDSHLLIIDPVKLKEVSKDAPGATRPHGTDALQELEHL